MSSYFKITGNIERIGDHAMNICEYTQKLADKHIRFSEEAQDEIRAMEQVCLDTLDLLEQEMLSRGRLVSLQVSGNKMVVAMSGMSLDQISRMFDVIQQSPIVSNVELNLASTEDGNVSTILDFTVRITLRSAEEADK